MKVKCYSSLSGRFFHILHPFSLQEDTAWKRSLCGTKIPFVPFYENEEIREITDPQVCPKCRKCFFQKIQEIERINERLKWIGIWYEKTVIEDED